MELIYLFLIIPFLYILYLGRKYFKGGQNTFKPNCEDKVFLVTGGTGGIGRDTVQELSKLGATVIFTGRNVKAGESISKILNSEYPKSKVSFYKVDFTSLEEIKKFANTFMEKFDRLDVLVNNAGGLSNEKYSTTNGYDGLLQSNYISPFYLTELLWPKLANNGKTRVVNIASLAALAHKDFKDPNYLRFDYDKKDYEMVKSYEQSKALNVLFCQGCRLLNEKNGTQVKSASVHPGVVNSGFADNYFKNPTAKKILSILINSVGSYFFKTS